MNKFVATVSRALLAGTIRRQLIKEIKGWDNIPKEGNFILVSNHLSHMDWFMSGYVATPRKFTFIAQVDQYTGFKKLWRNIIYWYGGIIPINRKSDESKRQAIETAIKMLKNGYCVVIYPEGGRAYDGVMRDFKSGVGKIYLESGVKVLPIALKGTNELMPPHGRLKFKKTAHISIGKPMEFLRERERVLSLDKDSKEYHNICANVAAHIEREVRDLYKKQH